VTAVAGPRLTDAYAANEQFLPRPVPAAVVARVLAAAHDSPSVGPAQPWDFLVITARERRERIAALARRQHEEHAAGHARARGQAHAEPVLDAPLNIAVTCDRTRGGPPVPAPRAPGRHGRGHAAAYSSVLAVAGLWSAAQAEGLAVGWVSFYDERELAAELGLPAHAEIVAYLCAGYVRTPAPGQQAEPGSHAAGTAAPGWALRRPLAWAVHAERYGLRGLPGEAPVDLLEQVREAIAPLDIAAMTEAAACQDRQAKPRGSLGVLESVPVQLAGLAGRCPPPAAEPAAIAIFAADHGVHAQRVTACPQEATARMVASFLAGRAVVNSFAAQAGADVSVVDVGVAAEIEPSPGLIPRKIAWGTADFTLGPAMTREQAATAIGVGIEVARDLAAAGHQCLVAGDMGTANTTASAALICAFTGRDPAEVTGRGSGIDAATFAAKVGVISRGMARHRPDPTDPVGVLAAFGGFEHAAIAGFILGAAALRIPVILDGVITGSAALAAAALCPAAIGACVAGHRSADAGHTAVLDYLGLRPLIDLGLRLGEGTGALLALPLVQSAVRALRDAALQDPNPVPAPRQSNGRAAQTSTTTVHS
jgi:nicotinate-nucleotide--dimethylbenzimidazole phosphoribosyltransferase